MGLVFGDFLGLFLYGDWLVFMVIFISFLELERFLGVIWFSCSGGFGRECLLVFGGIKEGLVVMEVFF